MDDYDGLKALNPLKKKSKQENLCKYNTRMLRLRQNKKGIGIVGLKFIL